jgi:hypothetical protein
MNTNDFNPDGDAINFNLPAYNYLQNNVYLITIDDLNKMMKKFKKKRSKFNNADNNHRLWRRFLRVVKSYNDGNSYEL